MPAATSRHTEATLRRCPASVVRCVAAFDSAMVRMHFTQAILLNTVVTVPRFVDANDESFDSIDQSGYRKLRDEVMENLSATAVDQTSVKHVITTAASDGCVVRNARRLNSIRRIVVVVDRRLHSVLGAVSIKLRCVDRSVRWLIDYVGSVVSAAESSAARCVSAGLAAHFLTRLKATPTRSPHGPLTAINTRR